MPNCGQGPPFLDTSRDVPLTAETASDSANSLCAAVCSALTGWNSQAIVWEELLVKHRREGPYSRLYTLPLSNKHWDYPEELELELSCQPHCTNLSITCQHSNVLACKGFSSGPLGSVPWSSSQTGRRHYLPRTRGV